MSEACFVKEMSSIKFFQVHKLIMLWHMVLLVIEFVNLNKFNYLTFKIFNLNVTHFSSSKIYQAHA